MPEIKATTTDSEKTAPKAEKLFELPPRRKYSLWYIIFPVGLILALLIGWLVYSAIPKATAPEASIVPESTTNDAAIIKGDSYYLTLRNEVGTVPGTFSLYRYSAGANSADEKVADITTTALAVHGKYREPYQYVVSFNDEGALKVLNAKTGKVEPLLETGEKGYVRDTAISKDGAWLAYGLTNEGTPTTSEIWIYNLDSKEKKQVVKKTEMGTYQGYSVLGWRNNDQELVVSALGGDAGSVWGDIYLVSVETGAMTKVTPASATAMSYFIRGSLSPNGDLWMYTFCTTPQKNSDEMSAMSEPCTTGTEIRTYDFASKQTKIVFHNQRFDNNVNKNLLRSILSMQWQDDKTIVAAIPGAIIEIDANAKDKVVDLLTYDRNDPAMFKSDYVSLVSATSEEIVFMRENGAQVFSRSSKKTEILNTENRSENFTHWLN